MRRREVLAAVQRSRGALRSVEAAAGPYLAGLIQTIRNDPQFLGAVPAPRKRWLYGFWPWQWPRPLPRGWRIAWTVLFVAQVLVLLWALAKALGWCP